MAVSRARLALVSARDMKPRLPHAQDFEALASLWFESWRDAHVDLLSSEIAADRSLDSFRQRLVESRDMLRTVGAVGKPLGFTIIRGSELHQLYVGREARGLGIAALLIQDAEVRLRKSGVRTAWLDCAIGNDRAARFYEKQNWLRTDVVEIALSLRNGSTPLKVWRYEKTLTGNSKIAEWPVAPGH